MRVRRVAVRVRRRTGSGWCTRLRVKLKRLVNHGILTEPEPGLFTLTPPAPVAPETGSS